MVYVTTGVLVFLVVAYVLQPFFAKGQSEAAEQEPNGGAEVAAQISKLSADLEELEFDFRLGKVSAEDFESLKQSYEEERARLLSKTRPKKPRAPRPSDPKRLEEDIEAEIAAARQKQRTRE